MGRLPKSKKGAGMTRGEAKEHKSCVMEARSQLEPGQRTATLQGAEHDSLKALWSLTWVQIPALVSCKPSNKSLHPSEPEFLLNDGNHKVYLGWL